MRIPQTIAAAFTPNARRAIGGPMRAHATFRLGLAFLLSGLSIWLSVLLGGNVGPGVFPFLFPICILSVWFGGILSGIIVTVLLALGAAYYHLPPRGWYISNTADVIGLSVFVLSGFMVSWVVDSLQRSHNAPDLVPGIFGMYAGSED